MAEAKAVATGSSSDNASMVSSLLLTDEYSIPPTGLPRQRRMKGARHQARPAELHRAALRSGRAHPARARGRVLLGTRGPSPSSARDDRVPPHHPVPPGAVAREARSPRGLAADRLVRSWWPDAPGRVVEVRFAHSPGWLDPSYLKSLRAFDAAFVLEGGIVAVDVKYHERAKAEIPRPENLARYIEVARRSGAF